MAMQSEQRKLPIADADSSGNGVAATPVSSVRPVEGMNGRSAETGDGENGESAAEVVFSWVKTVLTALLIVVIINSVLMASVVVPTGSMENEVMAGDFLFVNKFIYGGSTPQTIPFLNVPLPYFRLPGIREPEKGDVIVFIFPGMRDQIEPDEFQYYLKRCVATAGDTLEIRDARVFVNGVEQAPPPHVRFDSEGIGGDDRLKTFPIGADYTRDNWGPMRIPKKGDVIPLDRTTYDAWKIFIAREGHDISMQGEIIDIDGEPVTSYVVERDYCFGMGDNRSNSLDSRYWGFIPIEDVVGSPWIVYWSWDPDIPLRRIGDKVESIRWGRILTAID